MPDAKSSQPHYDRDDVVARLNPRLVELIYGMYGVKQFKPGGAGNWKAFVPWRDNVHDEAMTIRQKDGVWSDKALGEGGSIFDAAIRSGRATSLDEAITFVAEQIGYTPVAAPPVERKVIKTTEYIYTDAEGAPLYKAVREDYVRSDTGEIRKQFRQRTWAKGKWAPMGPPNDSKVLYGLPRLSDPARSGEPVFLVEGEKCADVLAESFDVLSTCIVGGSGAWLPLYAEQLRGRDVVILPDNDEPGYKFAEAAANDLAVTANSVRIVELPLGPRVKEGGKDIVDWIDGGGERAALLEAVAGAELWTTPEPKRLIRSMWDVWRNPPQPDRHLIEGVLVERAFGMVVAQYKSYKGFFVLDMLCSLASGTPFLGAIPIAGPMPVVYWCEEGSAADILRRVNRWCAARNVTPGTWMDNLGFVYGEGIRLTNEEQMQALEEEIAERRPAVVICDTMARVSAGLDENSVKDMALIIEGLDGWRRRYGTTALYVHHTNNAGKFRGSSSLPAACDIWIDLEKFKDANRIGVKVMLKGGHMRNPFSADLLDDDNGDGALFLTTPVTGVDTDYQPTVDDLVWQMRIRDGRMYEKEMSQQWPRWTDENRAAVFATLQSENIAAPFSEPTGGRPRLGWVLSQ